MHRANFLFCKRQKSNNFYEEEKKEISYGASSHASNKAKTLSYDSEDFLDASSAENRANLNLLTKLLPITYSIDQKPMLELPKMPVSSKIR
jgi:hypothetical protein